MKAFGAILIVLGYIAMALATISGIGYFLYMMGVVGLAFGPAAWQGFVLFLKLLVGGLVTMFAGALAVS